MVPRADYMAVVLSVFGLLENYPTCSNSILDPLDLYLIKLVGWQALEQAVTIVDVA